MRKIDISMVIILFMILPMVSFSQQTEVDTVEDVKVKDTLTEYRRSSLYSVLISHSSEVHGGVIDSIFMSIPLPDKFNNHDLTIKSFESTAEKAKRRSRDKDAVNTKDINNFIVTNNIGKCMIAKWFNRDTTTGAFDMELIHERGYYDASQDKINQAATSLYGKDILADAGMDLIGKTFMIVNDITYSDTGEKTAKTTSWIKLAAAVASGVTGSSEIATLGNTAGDLVKEIDGFGVNITSNLYCLDWSEDKMNEFFDKYWVDTVNMCDIKKMAFDTTSLFTLRHVGQTITTARNVSIKSLALKTDEEQITKVCARAIDKSIVDLQREYDEFKVSVPIGMVNEDGTVEVPIGLKEGLNEKSQYEVLIGVESEDGSLKYDKIGTISPIKDKIWDNRFGALEDHQAMLKENEENPDNKVEANKSDDGTSGNPLLTATTFKIDTGKSRIIPGCLVREITIKRN